MKKYYLLMLIIQMMFLISKSIPLEEIEKDNYFIKVIKMNNATLPEEKTFDFTLLDNNFTDFFLTMLTKEQELYMDHFLIKEFTEPLQIIQTSLTENVSTIAAVNEYKNISAGDIYYDYDEETGETLLNIELTDNNLGYPVGKLKNFSQFAETIASLNDVSSLSIIIDGEKKIKLGINYCFNVDLDDFNFGVYFNERFVTLDNYENCWWKYAMPNGKDNADSFSFQTLLFREYFSEKNKTIRNYYVNDFSQEYEDFNDGCKCKKNFHIQCFCDFEEIYP